MTDTARRMHAPRMTDLESDAWLGLVDLVQLLPAALDSQLERDAGLTHFDYLVLSLLRAERGGAIRLKEIATTTSASLPRVSKVVSRLERRGLVRRAVAAGDRRASDISLTDEGRRAVIRATGRHIDFVRHHVIDLLDEDQLAQLATITGIIARALPARS